MWMLGWMVVAAVVSLPGKAIAQTSCSKDEAYSVLDFWVGEDGSTLFRGEITRPDGTTYFDQTRLTPLEDSTVRQVIEVSGDGETWCTTFDAIYVPKSD